MKIMDWRHEELQRSVNGLNATDIPLVALGDNGFEAAGFTDNKGIFYFIPKVVQYFGLSLDHAILIFFIFLVLLGTLTAIVCFCRMFTHWSSRLISILGVFSLAAVALRHLDVYIAFFFAVAMTVPVFILFHQRGSRFSLPLIGAMAISGLVIGYANFIRCHAGTGVLLFLILWIALRENFLKKEKVICFFILIVCALIPYYHFNRLERNRDAFLVKHQPTYQRVAGFPVWHLVYNGLGYLDNKYGLEYSDSNGMKGAQAVDPNVIYCSDEYYQILKHQFFSFLRSNPWFVLKTVIAKAMNLLLKIVVFANFGILFYLYIKPPTRVLVPFIVAAIFYSLQGVLVVPYSYYVLGMISIATIFGLYMIGLGLEKYLKTSQNPSLLSEKTQNANF